MRRLLFALAVALVGWLPPAQASVVLHRGQDGIVAHSSAETLDSLGRVWTINGPGGEWMRASELDPPMPIDQILFWQPSQIVTTAGEFWWKGTGGWINHGPWPGVADIEESTEPAPHPGIQNRPNPTSDSVQIEFALGTPGEVEVAVMDAAGRRVRSLVRGAMPAGNFSLTWDGRNDSGVLVPSGVFFTKVATEAGVLSGRIVLSR